MRRTLCLVALLALCGAPAWADEDAHAEMAAALAAQADVQPAPLVLPVVSAAPRHAAPASAVKRGTKPPLAADAARAAANRISQHAQAQAASQSVARQAQAAAAAAAGQAQAQAAKDRVTRPRPRVTPP